MNANHGLTDSSVQTLRGIKRGALAITALMLAGIVGLMILAAGKGEDITGIVAPALLVALLSGSAAMVAALMQKRARPTSGTPRQAGR